MNEERKEWFKWRHSGIGSSEAPIIHGASKWKTRYELGEQKRFPTPPEETPTTYVQAMGNNMEPIARGKFAAFYNMMNGTEETFEALRVERADAPWLISSLDGISNDRKTIVEFKWMGMAPKPGAKLTEGQLKHLRVLDESLPITSEYDKVPARVPYGYWIQCQHQLMSSNAEACYFASFDGDTLNFVKFGPDLDFFAKHYQLCVEFRELVLAGKPQPLAEKDYKSIRNAELQKDARRWKTLKAEIEEREAEKKMLQDRMVIAASEQGHDRVKILDVGFIRSKGRAGAVDWKRYSGQLLHELKKREIDFGCTEEDFRKPDGESFFTVREISSDEE